MKGKNVSYKKDVKILLFEKSKLLVDDELFDFNEEVPEEVVDTCLMNLHHEYMHKIVPHLLSWDDDCRGPKIFFYDKLSNLIKEKQPYYELQWLSDMSLNYKTGEFEFECSGYDNQTDDDFDFFNVDFEILPIEVTLILAQAQSLTKVEPENINEILIRFYDPYIMNAKTQGKDYSDVFCVYVKHTRGTATFTINQFFDQNMIDTFFSK